MFRKKDLPCVLTDLVDLENKKKREVLQWSISAGGIPRYDSLYVCLSFKSYSLLRSIFFHAFFLFSRR